MKTLVVVLLLSIGVLSPGLAQEPVVVEARFQVAGLCGMCKSRIEKALKIKEVKYAKWDKKSKELFVAYLSPSITVDSLKQRVAAVGHDTDTYKAPDAVYSALPECCLYRDGAEAH
jgi:hypothetical protein